MRLFLNYSLSFYLILRYLPLALLLCREVLQLVSLNSDIKVFCTPRNQSKAVVLLSFFILINLFFSYFFPYSYSNIPLLIISWYFLNLTLESLKRYSSTALPEVLCLGPGLFIYPVTYLITYFGFLTLSLFPALSHSSSYLFSCSCVLSIPLMLKGLFPILTYLTQVKFLVHL